MIIPTLSSPNGKHLLLASRYPKASALGLVGRMRKRALAPGVCSPLLRHQAPVVYKKLVAVSPRLKPRTSNAQY